MRILRLAAKKNVTTREIADAISVPASRLGEILNSLPPAKLRTIAEMLGTTPEKLTLPESETTPIAMKDIPEADITALVQDGGRFYRADTLRELADITGELIDLHRQEAEGTDK
jgi:hypothetical protein